MGCKNVDPKRLYKLLEVGEDASRSDIRKAHQRLARVHHPDRGGDAETFKDMQKAYEVLSDPEKRRMYDQFGGEDPSNKANDPGVDLFDLLRGGHGVRGARSQRRMKTESVASPLKVTLEQLYSGTVKKMAVNRQVLDQTVGVQVCQDCGGRGAKVEKVQLGGMVQHMQSPCGACSSTGSKFSRKKLREVLEVHVQKGALDGSKVTFREKADEMPDADTGDVVFVIKEQKHPEFKRKGADLYIERTISLVEALCGFEIELEHLDGRKLLIKTAPGEVTRPMAHGFDPLAEEEDGEVEWESFAGFGCPDIETAARADSTDIPALKKACQTQLKQRGLDVGAFVVDSAGVQFKQCTRSEALAAKKPLEGATMYVVADPSIKQEHRLMKAVVGEGMPTLKNPFVHGNLFLILNIQFPESLPQGSLQMLHQLLPPPLHEATVSKDDPNIEVHTMEDMDPVASRASNMANMQTRGEAYDDGEEARDARGGQGPQCQQM